MQKLKCINKGLNFTNVFVYLFKPKTQFIKLKFYIQYLTVIFSKTIVTKRTIDEKTNDLGQTFSALLKNKRNTKIMSRYFYPLCIMYNRSQVSIKTCFSWKFTHKATYLAHKLSVLYKYINSKRNKWINKEPGYVNLFLWIIQW